MKDLKISKELIKAVLKKETETLSKDFNFTINEDYIEFSDDGEMQFEYCIYKFAFKCKEWAVKYNFQLVSWTVVFEAVKKKGYCQTHNTQDKNRESDKPFREDTEVEAIIKASEYVLSEVNK